MSVCSGKWGGGSDAVLLARWQGVVKEIMARTEKFPKRVRFTFSIRIENLALDIYEILVEARFSKDKAGLLKSANLNLEKLRLLLRLAHEQEHLDHRGYEHVSRMLDECGRMLGGWMKASGRS